MDIFTVQILTSLATSYFTAFTSDAVKQLFATAFRLKPSLEKELQAATTSEALDRVFAEATAVIDANAASGSIDIDGALLEAIRGIRFDHAQGRVTISNSTLAARILITGGSAGSSGQTVIGGQTELKSQGTSIKIGTGASIKITGDANIRQT